MLMTLVVVGCNVTRNLPAGEYLVSKVKFDEDKTTPRDQRITVDKDGIDVYVRQSPNKRFLGIDFYVWVYEHADPEKDNWWNNFKRKIGEEPVLLDMELTEKSITNLETYMRTKGYFHSDVTYDIDTTRRARRAEITYKIRQGEPTRINSLRYSFRDSSLRNIILADSNGCLIKRGDEVVHVGIMAAAKRVDTTGAGDFYAAGFMHGLCKGLNLRQCGTIGAITAGAVIEVVGTTLSSETWQRVLQRVAEVETEKCLF